MPDFFDRFGDQLYAAQLVTSPAERRGRFARLLRRKSAIFGAVAVAVAVPGAALAITQPWQPQLSRPGVDKPVQTDASPVADEASGAFAVLRRSQTASDRASAAPLVQAIGMGNQVDRVQTEGIRMVAPGWAVVPAKVAQTAPSDVAARDQLCLTDGDDVGCTNAQTATSNGVGILTASMDATHLTGLVPDGVASVRFTPDSGPAVEATTTNGFFELTVPSSRTMPAVKAPAGYDGPATVPGPPAPAAGTLTWLDSSGRAIGPADPAIG